MSVTKFKVRVTQAQSKAKINRASWSVRVRGKQPEWYHTETEAEARANELRLQQHTGGRTILKSEAGTLRAAIELYAAKQMERVEQNKIGFIHGTHSGRDAFHWIEEKQDVLFDDCIGLPPDHYKIRRRAHVKEQITVPRVYEGVELGAIKCCDVTAPMITEWLEIFDGLSMKTIKEKCTALKQSFDIAVTNGWAMHNPARLVKLEETKYGETEAEVEAGTIERLPVDKIRQVIEAANDAEMVVGNTHWCDGLALSFAVQTGLRFGELAALKWKFVDFEKKRVYVRTAMRKSQDGTHASVGITKTVKSGQISKSRRSVFLTPNLIAALKEWKLRSPMSGDDDRVFLTHDLKMHETSAHLRRNVLHKACDEVGLDRIRWHDLRHFFASLCVDRYGDNWERIADLLGHETTATTRKHYAEWIDNLERDHDDGEAFNDALWAQG